MEEQIIQQLVIGVLAVAIGVSGWLLPYKWNLLRLRSTFARVIPEETNKKLPKIVGAILIFLGSAILLGTLVVGKFK